MPILPVKLESRAIGCCGGDYEATIGEPWSIPVIFHPMSWEEAQVMTSGWSVVDQALVRARGNLRSNAEGETRPSLDLGSCTVGFSIATLAKDVIAEGIALAEWHVPWNFRREDAGFASITVRGIVRRIRGYEQIRTPDPDDPGFRGWPTEKYELIDGDSIWMGSDIIIDLDVGGGSDQVEIPR